MRAILFGFILMLCASCGDSRGSGGIQFGDGSATFDTATAAKRKAERTITAALSDELGVTWRISTLIAEEPQWEAANERWRWDRSTTTVTLAGSGPLAMTEAEIRQSVGDYLTKYQRPGAPAPSVTVHVERLATVSTTVGDQPTAMAPPSDGWRYTIKTGDTLAQISSAFYGSPEHWRRILDANPGLRLEHLGVGTLITIPPAPEPSPEQGTQVIPADPR